MRRALLLHSTLLALAAPSLVLGQGRDDVVVDWFPHAPLQGSFAYVVVRVQDKPALMRGAIDRVPVTFERLDDRFVGLGAVRLSAGDSVTVVLWLEDADGSVDTHRAQLAVRNAEFATERLSVAPRFSAEPDSALQARVRSESRRAREVAARALETPRLWRFPFTAPRDSRITSGFGKGRIFNGELRSRHWGTDFDGDMGDPVRATNRGVVALVADFYYGGRVVYLNHGTGLVTAYLHLSETLVAVGDTVAGGQVIGRVGASGRVTGPHLHWSARLGPATVNALSLLSLPALGRERGLGTR